MSSRAPPAVATGWRWAARGRSGSGIGSPLGAAEPTPPSPVAGLSDVVAVAAGGQKSLALDGDGTVWEWDRLDSENGEPSPPSPVAGLSDVVAVAAGTEHSLALRSDGTVWAWGNNEYGQLGDGTTGERRSAAVGVQG